MLLMNLAKIKMQVAKQADKKGKKGAKGGKKGGKGGKKGGKKGKGDKKAKKKGEIILGASIICASLTCVYYHVYQQLVNSYNFTSLLPGRNLKCFRLTGVGSWREKPRRRVCVGVSVCATGAVPWSILHSFVCMQRFISHCIAICLTTPPPPECKQKKKVCPETRSVSSRIWTPTRCSPCWWKTGWSARRRLGGCPTLSATSTTSGISSPPDRHAPEHMRPFSQRAPTETNPRDCKYCVFRSFRFMR